ncbi:sensor histidine kinase [Actinomadura xylanilytica]|uniref:sensor histidine kinase n=1 Tax=Actinomadura xylanilytica TaxID=887459 RepID=UPI00255AF925|nr:sensor histidine kinase [Actinomadura xylanilytica]MDL4775151.1 sensor histidine kinase [Actinomadura xylanilytica]
MPDGTWPGAPATRVPFPREQGDRDVNGSQAGSARRRPRLDLEKVDRSGPGPQAFCFWMVILIWPLVGVVQGKERPAWLAALMLAALAGLYLSAILTTFNARFPLRVPVLLLLAQSAVTSAGALTFEDRWFLTFPLLGLATGVLVGHLSRSGEGPEFTMLLGIGGVTTLCLLVAWADGQTMNAILGNTYGTITAGLVSAIIVRLFLVVGMLRDAREELADAAVAQERLRFSRDLHDLLGHTLSLMVVKAQAVRRIAERDPRLAAAQATDIETVGREALTEVRQAVSGYRGRGLTAELDAARTALSDSGIEVTVRRAGPPLPPEPDALLGWAIREGVTNVIRHSHARHCEITVRHDDGRAQLEIHDSGAAQGTPPPGRGVPSTWPGGHGLRGLTERMDAVDGTVEAGPAAGGGYILKVTVPIGAAA